MFVGLGTGSTVAHLLPAIAAREITIRSVATSVATEDHARELGIPVEPFEGVSHLDIAIDGADQIAPDGWLVKGGGAAHVREKIVAAAADRFVVIADSSKPVERIAAPIPLELLRYGVDATLRHLSETSLRDVPPSPDGGLIADYMGDVPDPRDLAARLAVGTRRGRPRTVRTGADRDYPDRQRRRGRAPRPLSNRGIGQSGRPAPLRSVEGRLDSGPNLTIPRGTPDFRLHNDSVRRDLIEPGPGHDACGVACVARLDAIPRHDVIERALIALERLEHRGAAGADGKSGDGAGIKLALEKEFVRDARRGVRHRHARRPLHGPVRGRRLLPRPRRDRAAEARANLEQIVARRGPAADWVARRAGRALRRRHAGAPGRAPLGAAPDRRRRRGSLRPRSSAASSSSGASPSASSPASSRSRASPRGRSSTRGC